METVTRLIKNLFASSGKKTYAQYGEDIIIDGLCKTIGIAHPCYIDIGTHHATNLSNSYFFYSQGSTGICVEPSPDLARAIAKKRPKDIVRAIGIGPTASDKPLPYYVLTAQTMNTFSKEDAVQTINAPHMYGAQKIERIEHVPVVGINELFAAYQNYLDIVSIDTEGMDEAIVRGIDFTKYRPKIFCIETVTQSDNHVFEKNMSLIAFLKEKGYIVYADTYVNTIFVDSALWNEGSTIL